MEKNKYNYFITSNKMYMIIIALLIFIVFCLRHVLVGSIALSFYAILIIYNVFITKVKKDEWKKFIEDFSSNLDNATKNTLVKLPFPLIIISEKGNIMWYNQKIIGIVANVDILNLNICGIIKEFNVKAVFDKNKDNYKNIILNGKFFDLYINIINAAEGMKESIALVYFNDVTETACLIKEIEDKKETVMLIEVDNLDEVIKSTDENKKPMLIAEIESGINNYAHNLKAMLKKYSINKYVLCIQNKYIEKEIEKKFEILDIIREINVGNKLSATLSIGIGKGADTPLENEQIALVAKELALGRGGDQAVVKSLDKLSFFGGKTKEVEKRTKVRARVIAHALVNLINESSRVYIMGHINADMDCLGSAVGLHSAILSLNKECNIVLDSINNTIKIMLEKLKQEGYEDTFIDSKMCMQNMDKDTLLILVDVHNKGYVQNLNLVNQMNKIVIIDHHRRCADYIEGALLSYIEPYASSTSELVTEMIQYMVEKPKLKPVEAEALLAGICVDTKNFFFKTGVRTFEAASFLRRLGADTVEVKRMFSDNLETYLKRAEIIKSVKVKNNIAIAICPREIEDTVLAAQAADELLNITSIQASFVFVKIKDEIYISGRSLGDINVQIILEDLGGGGHMTMAGTKLSQVNMEEAEKMLQEAIDKYLMEGEE